MKRMRSSISMVPPTHPVCIMVKLLKDRPGVRFWVSYFASEVHKAVNIAVENESWPYIIDMLDLTLFIQFQIARNHFVV